MLSLMRELQGGLPLDTYHRPTIHVAGSKVSHSPSQMSLSSLADAEELRWAMLRTEVCHRSAEMLVLW